MMTIGKALLLAILLIATTAHASGGDSPEAVLERYFTILTTRDFENIGALMAPASMAELKEMMDGALLVEQDRGENELMRMVFGTDVNTNAINNASAEFYLERIAATVLKAASLQQFVIDNRAILGRVDEDENTVHIVARLHLVQGVRQGSEVLVYTLLREPDGWYLKFPPTITQLLALIEQQATND